MAVMVDPEKSSLLRAAPRLMQILCVLVRHKFLRALAGRGHWPNRILRRFAEGNLGRVQAPSIDAMGGRVSRILERLIGAIVNAALVMAGAMLVLAPQRGWHHNLGEWMVISGIFGTILVCISAFRPDRGRR